MRPHAQSNVYFDLLDEKQRLDVMNKLLHSLKTEEDMSTRHKVCDTVCQIAEHLMQKNISWPSLMQIVKEFVANSNPALRETTFLIVSGVSKLFAMNDPAEMAQLFNQGLQDSEMRVRCSCLKAVVSYLLDCDRSSRDRMGGIIPLLLNVLCC